MIPYQRLGRDPRVDGTYARNAAGTEATASRSPITSNELFGRNTVMLDQALQYFFSLSTSASDPNKEGNDKK